MFPYRKIVSMQFFFPFFISKYKYNNFLEGEFIVAANTNADYEVRAFLRRCNGEFASCICAVAVRLHDDVIVMNRCGPKEGDKYKKIPLELLAYLNGEIAEDLQIGRMRDDKIRVSIFIPMTKM